MIKCECDICGFEGNVADFLFPRNNEPSFMGYFDYSTMTEADRTVFLRLEIHTDYDQPETAICKGCLWKTVEKCFKQYGPVRDAV